MTDVKSQSAFDSDEWRSGLDDSSEAAVSGSDDVFAAAGVNVSSPDAEAGAGAVESTASPLFVPAFDDLVAPVELPRKRPPLAWVVGAVVAVIVTVAVVAGVIMVKPFSGVRAADYSEGTRQTAALQQRYDAASAAVDDALSFLYAQDGTYDSEKAVALKQKAVALRKDVQAFEGQRATKDANVADAYDAYSRQALHFAELAENLSDSAKPLSDTLTACNNAPSVTIYDADFYAQYEQYVSDCSATVTALNKAPAKVVADLSDTMSANLGQMTDLINQMKTIGNASDFSASSEKGKQLQELSTQLVDLDFSSSILPDFSDKLQQARDNADPTALLKKLNTALKQGYNEKTKK